MIKLVCTDIDGTILKSDYTFSQNVKNCMQKITEKGVKVVLVTGRMHSAAKFIATTVQEIIREPKRAMGLPWGKSALLVR